MQVGLVAKITDREAIQFSVPLGNGRFKRQIGKPKGLDSIEAQQLAAQGIFWVSVKTSQVP